MCICSEAARSTGHRDKSITQISDFGFDEAPVPAVKSPPDLVHDCQHGILSMTTRWGLAETVNLN